MNMHHEFPSLALHTTSHSVAVQSKPGDSEDMQEVLLRGRAVARPDGSLSPIARPLIREPAPPSVCGHTFAHRWRQR